MFEDDLDFMEDNDKTYFAKERIFLAVQETEFGLTSKSFDFAFELERRNAVYEGVKERLKELGVTIEVDDIEKEKELIIKELEKRYKKFKDINSAEAMPRSVKNWIKGGNIETNTDKYRPNLYELCMVLNMDIKNTVLFFVKNFMTLPFIFKSRIDTIYYYAILNGKTYNDINMYISKTNVANEVTGEAEDFTQNIPQQVNNITNESEFIDYIKKHTYTEEMRYNYAIGKITELKQICIESAEKEKDYRETSSDFLDLYNRSLGNKETGRINEKGLLNIIYGFDTQEFSFKDNLRILPDSFVKNLPYDMKISEINNHKAKPETIKKALILYKFYSYYSQSLKKYKNIWDFVNRDTKDAEFEDFIDEVNLLLSKGGFGKLYLQNPFDWIIAFCAYSNDPLATFRQLFVFKKTGKKTRIEKDFALS